MFFYIYFHGTNYSKLMNYLSTFTGELEEFEELHP
jgi:hypothetical protein